MSDVPFAELGVMAVGGGGTVMWWLLRQKDEKQEAELKQLWLKHDEDAKQLQELRVKLAEEHYPKRELDMRFEQINSTMTHGFEAIGNKLDILSQTMISHISNEKLK